MFGLLQKKKNEKAALERGKAIVLPLHSRNRGLEFLVELIKKIRPGRPRDFAEAELKFQAFLFQLQQDRSVLFSLRKALLSQFMNSQIVNALTDSGIVSARGFVQELGGKIKHKILPILQQPDDFLFVMNRVFYKRGDYKWVEGIDQELWKQFFRLLGIQVNLAEPALIRQLQRGMQILSYRIANLGLEKEVKAFKLPGNQALYPFIEQNRLVNLYFDKMSQAHDAGDRKLILSNINEALYNCRQSIEWIREQRKVHGTSLAQTFILVRLNQMIERMLVVVDVLDADNEFNIERFILYFQTVVRNENRKSSLGEFLSQSLGLLAYQISEHGGKRGEQYITETRKDYWNILRSAMGGGFIISFVAIVKNLFAQIKVAPFWQGFLYSTNYSLGFILIDQTNSTLATKQPAYTAAAVAGSLDLSKVEGRPNLENLAITVARVSRSQIASFAGNLIIVFPLTYFLAWGFHALTGVKLAEGITASTLLADQHPFNSLALLYACFTGFFLFLSGLIAGYVENHIVYGKIPERLKMHPVFTNTFSEKRLNKMAHFVENHAGAIIGSIALGFFLGTAGIIGKLLGLPFDIRHITISAGNTAIGFYGLDHAVPIGYLITIISGVLLIGFLNFLVSFSLAFFVAVRSRGIKLREYPEFFGILGRYFKKHPADFIRPPKRPVVKQTGSL
jgi:site-specific recombinase